jgi:hypothetical protein
MDKMIVVGNFYSFEENDCMIKSDGGFWTSTFLVTGKYLIWYNRFSSLDI